MLHELCLQHRHRPSQKSKSPLSWRLKFINYINAMPKALSLLVAIALARFNPVTFAQTIPATIVSTGDGDTLRVDRLGNPHPISVTQWSVMHH